MTRTTRYFIEGFRIPFLILAALVAVPSAPALDVFKFDPAINLRFSAGGYAEGNLKESPRFILAGHDLSGVGWGPGNFGVTLISPRHFVTAAHVSPLAGSTVSFLSRGGTIKHYAVESVYYVEHAPGVRTDLAIGRLSAPIPATDQIGWFPTLRMPANAGYVGLKVFSFGIYQSCGTNTIASWGDYDALPFGHPDHVKDDFLFLTAWHQRPGEAQAQGNDSGSPTFVLYHGELAIVGVHSAVDVSHMPYLTADVLIPAYFTPIESQLARDGYTFGDRATPPPTSP